MTDNYPNSDFPYTLFFQGIPMPRWANCWGFVPARDSDAEWFVDRVWGRIDHVGIVESEEAGIFTIAAQEMLCKMLAHPDDDCLHYEPEEGKSLSREAIYSGLVGGLRQMIELAESEEVVFWTSGYPRDGEMLREAISKYRAGEFTPPHRSQWRHEIETRIWTQRRDLRRLAASRNVEKETRRFIHALPKAKSVEPPSRHDGP